MKKINKKKIVILTICLLVVLSAIVTILLSILPIKIKVDKEIEGMVFDSSNGDETAAQTYIRIKGIYSDFVFNWWHEDDFVGGIVVCDEPNIPDDIMDESYCHPYNYIRMFSKDSGYKNLYTTFIDYYTEGELIPFFAEGRFIKDGLIFSIDLVDYVAVFPATNTDEVKKNGSKLYDNFISWMWE